MTLSPDELAELRSTARSLLSRSSTSERVRQIVATERGFDLDLWAQMVELGWTTIHVPERFCGSGCGYTELAVVLHELGRALAPSPFLASAVLTTGALMAADNEGVAVPMLAEIVAGVKRGTVAFASVSGSYESTQRSVTWSQAGRGVRLAGISGFVLDADVADLLVVAARGTDDRAAAVLVHTSELASDAINRVPTIDLTRRLFTVAFDGVRIPAERMLTEPGMRAERLLDGLLALGTVATAVDAAGVAEQALDVTAAYAAGADTIRQTDRIVPGSETPLRQHGRRRRGEPGSHKSGRHRTRREPRNLADDGWHRGLLCGARMFECVRSRNASTCGHRLHLGTRRSLVDETGKARRVSVRLSWLAPPTTGE